ncbi:MAG: hypothetical protein WD904_06250 [Dehalococcoidia bacterium]
MSSTVIVVVSDLDNAAHGEINVMETPQKAARLVETLLESGYDQERIRVFSAEEFQMQVHHRPVVSLMTTDGDADEGSPSSSSVEEVTRDESTPVVAATVAATTRMRSSLMEEVSEPFTKNGVRFSTQFRPA